MSPLSCQHPFVAAMVRTLIQAGVRGKQLPVQTSLMFRQARQFNQDVEFIHSLCDEIIRSRLAGTAAAPKCTPSPSAAKQPPRPLGAHPPQGGAPLRPSAAKQPQDLLDLMLHGAGTETGLSVENIRYQMVTFLIAGHETTSGLLSFAF